jgi:hypothetical protein
LFEIARISTFSVDELAEYEASRMNILDYNASMKFARKEGVAIGEARGREEIFSLLEKGMSLDEVKEKFRRQE